MKNKHRQQQDQSIEAIEEAAYDYPDGNIVRYIFRNANEDHSKIEALMRSNSFLVERIDDLKAFIEDRGISTIDEYYKLTTRSSDAFMNAFSFAIFKTDEFQHTNRKRNNAVSHINTTTRNRIPDEAPYGF